jgi:hypothetical protein
MPMQSAIGVFCDGEFVGGNGFEMDAVAEELVSKMKK